MKRKPGRKAARVKAARTKSAPTKPPAKAAAKKSVRPASRRPAAPKPPDPVDALVAAGVQALRLPLDPAWHGGVKFNLQLILRLGALVDDFALPDDAEPGPVFHA
jgi:hypothetical protein